MRGEHCLYSCVLASFPTFFRPKAEVKVCRKAKCLRQETRLRHPSSSCSLFCSIKECLLHDNLVSKLQFYIFIVLVTTKLQQLHAPKSRETRDERERGAFNYFPRRAEPTVVYYSLAFFVARGGRITIKISADGLIAHFLVGGKSIIFPWLNFSIFDSTVVSRISGVVLFRSRNGFIILKSPSFLTR